MDTVWLKNFRCFREEQMARLAPLTLLVGENSTGKTSFMALIRALWDAGYAEAVPDFKEAPYDLGGFDEVVYNRSGRGGSGTIEAGMTVKRVQTDDQGEYWEDGPYGVDVTFVRQGTFPVPVKWRLARGDIWIEERLESESRSLHYRTPNGKWHESRPAHDPFVVGARAGLLGSAVLGLTTDLFRHEEPRGPARDALPGRGPSSITAEDRESLWRLVHGFRGSDLPVSDERPFASAPVRSKPRRTYDPARPARDPEGENIPMYLSTAFLEDKKLWEVLKNGLEGFGYEAGLFDEIAVRPLGKRGGEPFQIQVRKRGRRVKGPARNLIDVGYGVSQVLPVLTELFRDSRTSMFLLQQPEVHLHPSAQAALGSLFCRIARRQRQLVIETHSDHLLDRVRMDVRDGRSELKPGDVSILFFERGDLDVRIHSLRLDEEGNVLGAPDDYRRFFMEESRRSLKL